MFILILVLVSDQYAHVMLAYRKTETVATAGEAPKQEANPCRDNQSPPLVRRGVARDNQLTILVRRGVVRDNQLTILVRRGVARDNQLTLLA